MILADLEVDFDLLTENKVILFENTIILNICYTVYILILHRVI